MKIPTKADALIKDIRSKINLAMCRCGYPPKLNGMGDINSLKNPVRILVYCDRCNTDVAIAVIINRSKPKTEIEYNEYLKTICDKVNDRWITNQLIVGSKMKAKI